jgi:putative thiamine transport system ATP-binding protein
MALKLVGVCISLGTRFLIQGLDLMISNGEIVTLMGPSGSGKSSLLSFIAGELEAPFRTTGSVTLDGLPLGGLPPEARNIGRLFQDDLLFPHMTVGENLMFGIPRHAGDRTGMMRHALKRIELDGFENRPPQSLSGGQRARVALMRALLSKPAAMLLDEPFNKLDEELRATTRNYVFAHLAERAIPCLLVTHNRADAVPGGRVLRIGRDGVVVDV